MKSLFEQDDGTHSVINGYRIPNLAIPEQPEYEIGVWGHLRLDYLRRHRRGLYNNLLMSGKLSEHLHEIDVTAVERSKFIVKQMMAAEGVTEQLKVGNPMLWLQRVNNIRNRAGEIVRVELIYD